MRYACPARQTGATLIVALIILLLASLAAAAAVNTALTQERITAAQRERLRAINDVEQKILAARQQIDTIAAAAASSSGATTALRGQTYPIYGPSETPTNWTRKIEFMGDDFPCANELNESKLRSAETPTSQAIRCARIKIEARHHHNPSGPQVQVEYLYEIVPIN